MTTSAAIVTARCNPYGHETGGPRHLLGGLYGPEHEGPHKWHCENAVQIRARMECRVGHKGQIMPLCRAHAIEIQRRQADLCPKCAWPPEAVGLNEAMNFLQMEMSALMQAGQASGILLMGSGSLVNAERMRRLSVQLEQHQEQMTELYRAGKIQKNPLTLTEIS